MFWLVLDCVASSFFFLTFLIRLLRPQSSGEGVTSDTASTTAEIRLSQVNSFFQQQRLHLTSQPSQLWPPPILLHITSHRTDCPGAARAFLQPNKGTTGANSPGLFSIVLPFFPPLKLLICSSKWTSSFWSCLVILLLVKMHVIIPVCTWAPSRAGVLKYECKSASAQQKNCKRKKQNKKATVLHNNQY